MAQSIHAEQFRSATSNTRVAFAVLADGDGRTNGVPATLPLAAFGRTNEPLMRLPRQATRTPIGALNGAEMRLPPVHTALSAKTTSGCRDASVDRLNAAGNATLD